MEAEIGVIVGSGAGYFYTGKAKEIKVKTPYGNPSDKIAVVNINGERVAFLNRHGKKETIPPHAINYKANIWALKSLGVKNIFSFASVGIINEKIKVGGFILIDDFIDLTTYVHTFNSKEMYVDVTEPFSEKLRMILIKAAKREKISLVKRGIYANTKGPRFETKAEIKMLKCIGADVVGMTMAPEAVLSRELGIEYACVAIGTNYACGISKEKLTAEEVNEVVGRKKEELRRLLKTAILLLAREI